MAKLTDNQQWAYDKLKGKGVNVGTPEQYMEALKDPANREWVYKKLSGFGINVGKQTDFDNAMGYGEKVEQKVTPPKETVPPAKNDSTAVVAPQNAAAATRQDTAAATAPTSVPQTAPTAHAASTTQVEKPQREMTWEEIQADLASKNSLYGDIFGTIKSEGEYNAAKPKLQKRWDESGDEQRLAEVLTEAQKRANEKAEILNSSPATSIGEAIFRQQQVNYAQNPNKVREEFNKLLDERYGKMAKGTIPLRLPELPEAPDVPEEAFSADVEGRKLNAKEQAAIDKYKKELRAYNEQVDAITAEADKELMNAFGMNEKEYAQYLRFAQEKMRDFFVKANMPASDAEYFVRKWLRNNLLIMLGDMAMKPLTQRQYEDEGMAKYSKDNGGKEGLDTTAFIAGVATDPLMYAGGLAAKGAGKLVTNLASIGLKRAGVESAMEVGARLVTQSRLLDFASRAASGAAMMATIDAGGDVANQLYSTNQVDWGQTLKALRKGATVGTLFSFGHYLGQGMQNAVSKVFSKNFGVIAGRYTHFWYGRNVMFGSAIINHITNGGKMEDFDLEGEYARATVMQLFFDIDGAIKQYAGMSPKQMWSAMKADPSTLKITEEEIKQFNDAGIEGKTAAEIIKNIYADGNYIDKLFIIAKDPNIDGKAKENLVYLLTGNHQAYSIPIKVVMSGSKEEGYTVRTLDSSGLTYETRTFKKERDALDYLDQKEIDCMPNYKSYLESIVSQKQFYERFEEIYDSAIDKFVAQYGDRFSREDARRILTSEESELSSIERAAKKQTEKYLADELGRFVSGEDMLKELRASVAEKNGMTLEEFEKLLKKEYRTLAYSPWEKFRPYIMYVSRLEKLVNEKVYNEQQRETGNTRKELPWSSDGDGTDGISPDGGGGGISAVEEEIRRQANMDDGNIYAVSIKGDDGTEWRIRGGNFTIDKDGKVVSTDGSPIVVYTTDAEGNEIVKQVSAADVTLLADPISAEGAISLIDAGSAAQEEENKLSGEKVQITTPSGTIFAVRTGDGMLQILDKDGNIAEGEPPVEESTFAGLDGVTITPVEENNGKSAFDGLDEIPTTEIKNGGEETTVEDGDGVEIVDGGEHAEDGEYTVDGITNPIEGGEYIDGTTPPDGKVLAGGETKGGAIEPAPSTEAPAPSTAESTPAEPTHSTIETTPGTAESTPSEPAPGAIETASGAEPAPAPAEPAPSEIKTISGIGSAPREPAPSEPKTISGAEPTKGVETAKGEEVPKKEGSAIGSEDELESDRIGTDTGRDQTKVGTADGSMAKRFADAKKVIGGEASITIANGEELDGRYVLVDAFGLTPSHNPLSAFDMYEGYPQVDGQSINDRDYKKDLAEQNKVNQAAAEYDGRAVTDMPVISKEGLVFSGNGRTMAGQLAAKNGTDTKYKNSLAKNAWRFGFTKEQVEEVPNARVVFMLDEDLPYNTTSLAIFNANQMQSMGPTALAASITRRMNDQGVGHIVGAIRDFDNVDDFFKSNAASDLIDNLVKDGILSSSDIAAMFDGNRLSASGKETLTAIMLGTAFSEDVVRLLGSSTKMKNNVMKALPQILENRGLGALSAFEEINNAIKAVYEMTVAKMTFAEFTKQTTIDGKTAASGYSDFELLIAERMDSDKKTGLATLIEKYNTKAKEVGNGQLDIFSGGIATKEDIINLFVNKDGEQEKPQQSGGSSEKGRLAEGNKENDNAAGILGDKGRVEKPAEEKPAKPAVEQAPKQAPTKDGDGETPVRTFAKGDRVHYALGDGTMAEAVVIEVHPDGSYTLQHDSAIGIPVTLMNVTPDKIFALDDIDGKHKFFYDTLPNKINFGAFTSEYLKKLEKATNGTIESLMKEAKDGKLTAEDANLLAQSLAIRDIIEDLKAGKLAKKGEKPSQPNSTNNKNVDNNGEHTNKQTAADTVAVTNKGEAVAVAGASAATTDGTKTENVNNAIEQVNAAIKEVDKQLMLLGYYEGGGEMYSSGVSRVAESAAIADAKRLADRLAKDLGVSGEGVKPDASIGSRFGRVRFELPLNSEKSLRITIPVVLDAESDNGSLAVAKEEKTDSQNKITCSIHSTDKSKTETAVLSRNTDITYEEFLKDVREYCKGIIPQETIKEAAKNKVERNKQGNATVKDLFADTTTAMAADGKVVDKKQQEINNPNVEPKKQKENDIRRGVDGSDAGGIGNGDLERGNSSTGSSQTGEESGRTNGGGKNPDNGSNGRESGVGRLLESEKKNTHNFRLGRGEDAAPTNVRERFNANVAAIKLLKQLEEEGAETATPEQQAILSKFSGWGGLGAYFNEYGVNSREARELKSLMTDEEYNDANASRNSAYYTVAKYTDALWDIARKLGFRGGRFAENSAGIGNIIAHMPEDMAERSDITAVEIDSITGRMLKYLYPDAEIHNTGYEKVNVPNNSVDLAITNVPFVTGLRVRDENEKDLSSRFKDIHNFCIAKNIRKLAEGGIGIFISSNGTMDGSKDIRNWIVNEGNADVIGLFRLNSDTFGGTDATSDIIVVRKRVNGIKSPNAIDVLDTAVLRKVDVPVEEKWNSSKGKYETITAPKLLTCNKYLAEHPENMGGEMDFAFNHGDTRWGGTTVRCYPAKDVDQDERLQNWINSIDEQKMEVAPKREAPKENSSYEDTAAGTKEGEMILDKSGNLCISKGGKAVPLEVNSSKVKGKTKAECYKDYAAIKKALNELLEKETQTDNDAEIAPFIKALNDAYDKFVKNYGPINKNRSIPFLKNDIDFPSIASLEDYSESETTDGKKIVNVKKTDVFEHRVLGVKKEAHAENTRDGVILSVQQFGTLDPEKIAEWTGKDAESVKAEILSSKLGFVDPKTGKLEVSHEYLSGNVREKLAYAKEHNADGSFDKNIEELEKIIPTTIPSTYISPQLGSTWIPEKLYSEYAAKKFDLEDISVVHSGNVWTFASYPTGKFNTNANRTMGVHSDETDKDVLGSTIFLNAMNNVPTVVQRTMKKYVDGVKKDVTVTDKEASQAASNKADEMKDDFVEWFKQKMDEDAALSAEIEKIYNEKFNAIVPVEVGKEFLSEHLPGQNPKFGMYPHQQQAVVIGTMKPVLLAHEVGTGKTFTLISTAMEMRRLGTAKKPMIVVQNATAGQFVSSAKQLYPNAKVLTVNDKDRTREGRKEFYAKIKYNDWDIIVVPQSVFDMIPDNESRMRDFIQEKIDEKIETLERAKELKMDSGAIARIKSDIESLQEDLYNSNISGKNTRIDQKLTIKTIQNTTVRAEEQMDRKTDDTEDFDSMGIDAILIDEAHNYKHLGFATTMQRGVKGVDPSFSKRAASLYLKCQSVFDRCGHRNVVFATGTPISNTAAEVWTFMKYLYPKQFMKDNDIYYFDDFVHNFGSVSQALEFSTSGKFKENARFASYVNLPELARIWSNVTHTILTKEVDYVNDKVPEMEGGKAQDVFLPQSQSLIDIMTAIRAKLNWFESLSGAKKRENRDVPLSMYRIAKRAAIDTRLVSDSASDDPESKTNHAVSEILRSLEETKDYKGTVALFCDQYRRRDKNKVEKFNLFKDIKAKLVKAGVPETAIVIMESSMNQNKKETIFARTNAGEIRVIMGTTDTLGTGVNIQERLHTLIHMDAPDRPMDYTQRNGRILRQGNLHKEWGKPVRIIRFGVEDSLDVTGYQRLRTKAAFIDSVMESKKLLKNSLEGRTIEEPEEGLFDSPIAALSGSQYASLKFQAEREVRKLVGKKKDYERRQIQNENRTRTNNTDIEIYEKFLNKNKAILEKVKEHFPDGVAKELSINGVSATGEDALKEALKAQRKSLSALATEVEKNAWVDQAQTMEFPIVMDGVTFNVHYKMKRETGFKNGMPIVYVSKDVTIGCDALGIENYRIEKTEIGNVLNELTEDIVSGKLFSNKVKSAENHIASLKKDNADMAKSAAIDPDIDKKIEAAQKTVDDLTEKMKAEMAVKEAKYANIKAKKVDIDALDSDGEDEDAPEAQIIDEDYSVDSQAAKNLVEDLQHIFDENGLKTEIHSAEEAQSMIPTGGEEYAIVTDKELLEKLDNDPKGYVEAYCTLAEIDGDLYPPMASIAKVKVTDENGEKNIEKRPATPIPEDFWVAAQERTLDDPLVVDEGKGYWTFILIKPNGKDMKVAYNSYHHSTISSLNDQFMEAWNRPELGLYKVLIPKSDIESGYKAEGARYPVGEHEWKEGPVSNALHKLGKGRKVILSRYRKIIGKVPVAEEAKKIFNELKGTDIAIPINVVRPELREELIKLGAKFTDVYGSVPKSVKGEFDKILKNLGDQYVPKKKKEFQDKNGEVYGWYENGTLHFVEGKVNPNTQVHEYTHMWAAAMREKNRAAWNSIVRVLKRDCKEIWDKVVKDPNYKNLKDDDAIASEVLSRYSGSKNSKRLLEEEQQMLEQNHSMKWRARVRTLFNKVRKALKEFWGWVGDLFDIKEFRSAEEVADRVLYDLLNGTKLDPKGPGNGTREMMIHVPGRSAGESSAEYKERLNETYDSFADDAEVLEYSRRINKEAGAKYVEGINKIEAAKNELMRSWGDAAAPIEHLEEYIKEKGGVIKESAYKDTFLAMSRASTAQQRFEKGPVRELAHVITDIISSKALDAVDIRWQNLTEDDIKEDVTKRRNGTRLTARELIDVYAQAKDCEEAVSLGLPDRGQKGFINNLGMNHLQVIDAIEPILDGIDVNGSTATSELWRTIRAATSAPLDYEVERGFLTPEERAKYNREYYVPQRGWLERDMSGQATSYVSEGERYNQSYNRALKHAEGRSSLASGPIPYIMSIGNSTISMVEDNVSKQKFLDMCLENEEIGLRSKAFKIAKIWEVNMVDSFGLIERDDDGNPITTIRYDKPTAEYEHDKSIRSQLDDLSRKCKSLLRDQRKWEKIAADKTANPLVVSIAAKNINKLEIDIQKCKSAINDLAEQIQVVQQVDMSKIRMRTKGEEMQHLVHVVKDGQNYVIFLRDEKVANAINKNFEETQAKLNGLEKLARVSTRYFSAALTQFNMEFAASNFVRDYQVAIDTLMVEQGAKFTAQFQKNFFKVQGAVAAYAFSDKILDKEVFKGNATINVPDSTGSVHPVPVKDLLDEYFTEGAQTGFSYLSDIDVLRKDFDALIKENKAREIGRGVVGAFAVMTEISETAVRFAGYITARQNGMSKSESAYLSKELTTNFDRGGEKARSNWFALFSFLRATINGNLKFYRGFKRFAKGYSLVAAVYFGLGLLNSLLVEDDPENEVWFSSYTRQSNYVFGKFLGITAKIPVGHFLRMFHAAGSNLGEAIKGRKTNEEAVYDTMRFATAEQLPNYLDVFSSLYYDPATNNVTIDPSLYVRELPPSIITPFVDVTMNRDFTGRAINGERYNYKGSESKKDVNKYREDTNPFYVDLVHGMYETVGGDLSVDNKQDNTMIQNAFDVSPSAVQHVVEGYTPAIAQTVAATASAIKAAASGEEVYADQIPFMRKFYSSYRVEKAENSEYWKLNARVNAYTELSNATEKGNEEKFENMLFDDMRDLYDESKTFLESIDLEEPNKYDLEELMRLNKEWNKAFNRK